MIAFNNDWEFTPVWNELFAKGEGDAETVRIPHTVKELPLHYIDHKEYQMISGYRKSFVLPEEARVKYNELRDDLKKEINVIFYTTPLDAAKKALGVE